MQHYVKSQNYIPNGLRIFKLVNVWEYETIGTRSGGEPTNRNHPHISFRGSI